jgi:hypothetical protein
MSTCLSPSRYILERRALTCDDVTPFEVIFIAHIEQEVGAEIVDESVLWCWRWFVHIHFPYTPRHTAENEVRLACNPAISLAGY